MQAALDGEEVWIAWAGGNQPRCRLLPGGGGHGGGLDPWRHRGIALIAAQGGYVIGTCVLLWWLSGDPRLSREWQEQLRGARCLVTATQLAGFVFLAITPDHAAATALQPPHHRDPLDRLLIAPHTRIGR